MSKIGVDERSYEVMYSRTFSECLHRTRGDTTEARKLANYYMRDWYVVTDGDPDLRILTIDEVSCGRLG